MAEFVLSDCFLYCGYDALNAFMSQFCTYQDWWAVVTFAKLKAYLIINFWIKGIWIFAQFQIWAHAWFVDVPWVCKSLLCPSSSAIKTSLSRICHLPNATWCTGPWLQIPNRLLHSVGIVVLGMRHSIQLAGIAIFVINWYHHTVYL